LYLNVVLYKFKRYSNKIKTMKILLAAIFTTFSFFTLSAQKVYKTLAKIDNITVFLSKAQINSSFAIKLSEGNAKIFIDDIANAVDPSSIQVGGKGDLVILGVKYSPNYLNEKVSILQDSLIWINKEIENIEMLQLVAASEEKMIMANASIKSEKDGVLPEDLQEMIVFFRDKLTAVGKEKLKLKWMLEPILAKKRSSVAEIPLGRIELSVSVKKTTNANFEISYLVSNAGWSPNYDFRIKDAKNPVEIVYKAGVYQNTGLDWNNVDLTLSTFNPQVSGQKPELYPQFLSFYLPRPVYSKAKMNAPEMAMMKMEVAEASSDVQMGSIAESVQVAETALSVEFKIPVSYTIPSGGKAEIVEIQSYFVEAEFLNISVPKLDNYGFLIVKIKDWEKYNFIAGEGNVFLEGKYLGKTYLPDGNVQNELEISLGKDTKIVNKKEEIDNYKARRIIGSNVRVQKGFKITIRNTKNETIDLLVEDQVPVSQDSNIEVSVEEISGAEWDKETGKLKWNFRLAANESKEIFIKYTVKHPKDRIISNL
jgi:uncharacterized protein (TIGR02231 family)